MNKRLLTTLVKVIISCGLFYYLITRIGVDRLLLQVENINYLWILAGIVAFTISNILGSMQWRLLLAARGIDLPLLQIVSYYFVGLFFNNFLIGNVGGDAVRIYDISRASGDSAKAATSVFFDRFVGLLVLVTMALVSSLLWAKTLGYSNYVITVAVIFALWVACLVILFNKSLAKIFTRHIWGIIPEQIRQKSREIYNGINGFRHESALLVKITCLSIVIQLLRIIVHYFAALALGIQTHFIYFLIFIPIVAFAASLPVSIGGLGVREQSAVILFSRINILHAEIVLFELIAYFIGILATIPGGIVFIFRKEQVKSRQLKMSESY